MSGIRRKEASATMASRSIAAQAALDVIKNYTKDRTLVLFLASAGVGVSLVAKSQMIAHKQPPKIVEDKPQPSASAAALAVDGAPAKAAARKKAPAIDETFFKRLVFVLRIAVPSWHSQEALMLYTQTLVLVARSLLSLRTARLGGEGLKAILNRSWRKFGETVFDFLLTGAAASVVNSSLKYLTNAITVSFRTRLTRFVHSRYLTNRAYYKAAVLRMGNLDNADQRIAEDLQQFCATAADLFSRTFKPALDVVLSTRRMATRMGYTGLSILYSYFLCSGAVVRALSPQFPKIIAEQAAFEGEFRSAHARVIAHAEEIAFLEGAAREEVLLNRRLAETTGAASRYFLLQFRQGCVDQWFLKYFASCVGWPVLAVPFLINPGDDTGELSARYREFDSLMQGSCAAIGDLMMVYKKLQRLAGYTARVVELLEAVDEDSRPDDARLAVQVHSRPSIVFEDVSIESPDGRLLLKDFNLEITPGQSVIVTGANGAGKTSMFRVLAGLWNPVCGRVMRPRTVVDDIPHSPAPASSSAAAAISSSPARSSPGTPQKRPSMGARGATGAGVSLYYVPQRPYLVSGTLRDQITYPQQLGPGDDAAAVDRLVLECLRRVGLEKLALQSPRGLDTRPHDWADVLSGGEKQRVGLARLFFHRPAFAVLDEATSAINPEEEGRLYEQLTELGVTVFSIAHRHELARFHKMRLNFAADGTGNWTLTEVKAGGAAGGEVFSVLE